VSSSSSRWIAAGLAAGHPEFAALGELMSGREHLAVLPTPLHDAPRLSQALGRRFWLKRDDLTGTGLGGNKIRKLELLAAQARAQGADTLVSAGAAQSNHARTVATVAAMLHLDCHLVLGGRPPRMPSGNLLLDALMGATLHWVGSEDWADLATTTDEVADRLRRTGRRVFAIPVGGSVPHGAAAFTAAYLELLVQCAEAGLAPATVVHASSSAGTQAGLHLGSVLADAVLSDVLPAAAPQVVGADVAKITESLAAEVSRLAGETADLLGVRDLWEAASRPVAVLEGYQGPGYAVTSPESTAALHLMARTEGVILDPVYSAKGFQAACESEPAEPIVFWHTGGTPALFAEH
jgi:1-aminocyclopropane-1-carboxylate deaminase/D-cysteine desulfhydrase-like pyridoxal-dependent ACC family enzyme